LSVDIGGDELAASTHPTLQVNKMIGLADGLDALFDVLSLLGQSLMLTAGRLEGLLGLFKARRRFWRTAWAAFIRLIACALKTRLDVLNLLLCLGEGFVGSSLLAARGAPTALLSSCWTWNKSGA
jgi:hypothetical protein